MREYRFWRRQILVTVVSISHCLQLVRALSSSLVGGVGRSSSGIISGRGSGSSSKNLRAAALPSSFRPGRGPLFSSARLLHLPVHSSLHRNPRELGTRPMQYAMSSESSDRSGVDSSALKQPHASEIETFIRSLYSSNTKLSVHLTGGVQLFEWLLTVPGASACVVEANVPYAFTALHSLLDKVPDQYCSQATAVDMARAALRRTASLLLKESPCNVSVLTDNRVLGLACAAALVSNVPKRGPHRCFVAIASPDAVRVHFLELRKNMRSRAQEDYVCSRLLLDALGESVDVKSPLSLPRDYLLAQNIDASEVSDSCESISTVDIPHSDVYENLVSKRAKMALVLPRKTPLQSHATSPSQDGAFGADGEQQGQGAKVENDLRNSFVLFEDVDIPPGSIVFPGSFNPVHEGHVAFAAAALSHRRTKEEGAYKEPLVVFEIAVYNADKPCIPPSEVAARLRSLYLDSSVLFERLGVTNFAVCLTSEPLFSGKANVFKNCDFLVGSDTMERLLDPKYYGGSRDGMVAALATIAAQGCRFTVGGRVRQPSSSSLTSSTGDATVDQSFLTCDQVLELTAQRHGCALPAVITGIFEGLSESAFRADISSTAIRQRMKEQQQQQSESGK